jgi:hypothetical protein
MGKMKELSTQFEGYTVGADVYFPEKEHPEYSEFFVEPEFISAETVKAVINQVSNRMFKPTPNKATVYIYKTYGNSHEYSVLAKTIELNSRQCKTAWL